MWLILWFAGTIWSCFIIDSDHEIPSRAAEPLPGALPMLQISRESEIENLNTVIARFSYILGSSFCSGSPLELNRKECYSSRLN